MTCGAVPGGASPLNPLWTEGVVADLRRDISAEHAALEGQHREKSAELTQITKRIGECREAMAGLDKLFSWLRPPALVLLLALGLWASPTPAWAGADIPPPQHVPEGLEHFVGQADDLLNATATPPRSGGAGGRWSTASPTSRFGWTAVNEEPGRRGRLEKVKNGMLCFWLPVILKAAQVAVRRAPTEELRQWAEDALDGQGGRVGPESLVWQLRDVQERKCRGPNKPGGDAAAAEWKMIGSRVVGLEKWLERTHQAEFRWALFPQTAGQAEAMLCAPGICEAGLAPASPERGLVAAAAIILAPFVLPELLAGGAAEAGGWAALERLAAGVAR
jgi:hypothetical protein